MKHTKRKRIMQEVEDGFTCDICKTKFAQDNWPELQEAIHVKHNCGYGSVFGDLSTISLDICQHCFSQILGAYVQTKGYYHE